MVASDFKSLLPDKLTSEVVFRLLAMDGKGNINSFGSAFALHPYLLATAKHVVDEFTKGLGGGWATGVVELTFWAVQIQWKGDQHNYNIWQVTGASSSSYSDIALLKVSPYNVEASEYEDWKILRANLKLPHIGDKVVGFGCHKMTFEGSKKNTEGLFEHIELHDDLSAANGEILEIYPDKRDSVMLPFPVARVNAQFEPGMSGGPVINARSEVCGIICSSMHVDGEHESYISLLWPIVGIPVNYDQYASSPIKGVAPLMEMIKAGIWIPKGSIHVELGVDASGRSLVKYV